jgi:hypothetical protein
MKIVIGIHGAPSGFGALAYPLGTPPFRIHVDPTQDGAEGVNAASDRVGAELHRRIGLGQPQKPRTYGDGRTNPRFRFQ